jgi:hypothetical protein
MLYRAIREEMEKHIDEDLNPNRFQNVYRSICRFVREIVAGQLDLSKPVEKQVFEAFAHENCFSLLAKLMKPEELGEWDRTPGSSSPSMPTSSSVSSYSSPPKARRRQ